ncbi:hypothetical protein BDAP_001121 [Binucleata daphniae]
MIFTIACVFARQYGIEYSDNLLVKQNYNGESFKLHDPFGRRVSEPVLLDIKTLKPTSYSANAVNPLNLLSLKKSKIRKYYGAMREIKNKKTTLFDYETDVFIETINSIYLSNVKFLEGSVCVSVRDYDSIAVIKKSCESFVALNLGVKAMIPESTCIMLNLIERKCEKPKLGVINGRGRKTVVSLFDISNEKLECTYRRIVGAGDYEIDRIIMQFIEDKTKERFAQKDAFKDYKIVFHPAIIQECDYKKNSLTNGYINKGEVVDETNEDALVNTFKNMSEEEKAKTYEAIKNDDKESGAVKKILEKLMNIKKGEKIEENVKSTDDNKNNKEEVDSGIESDINNENNYDFDDEKVVFTNTANIYKKIKQSIQDGAKIDIVTQVLFRYKSGKCATSLIDVNYNYNDLSEKLKQYYSTNKYDLNEVADIIGDQEYEFIFVGDYVQKKDFPYKQSDITLIEETIVSGASRHLDLPITINDRNMYNPKNTKNKLLRDSYIAIKKEIKTRETYNEMLETGYKLTYIKSNEVEQFDKEVQEAKTIQQKRDVLKKLESLTQKNKKIEKETISRPVGVTKLHNILTMYEKQQDLMMNETNKKLYEETKKWYDDNKENKEVLYTPFVQKYIKLDNVLQAHLSKKLIEAEEKRKAEEEAKKESDGNKKEEVSADKEKTKAEEAEKELDEDKKEKVSVDDEKAQEEANDKNKRKDEKTDEKEDKKNIADELPTFGFDDKPEENIRQEL